jgi:Kef-type K+ transport system membrane component KefB
LGHRCSGWLWPDGHQFIFPKESMGVLKLFAQIGVCLFMFVVGLELEVSHLRQKAQTAVLVSHVSIIFPYFLGVLSALFLFSNFAAPGASFTAFALFMGIALSITAFPVLARILNERRMAKTYLGTTAIACAAVDDASAWVILAFVVATARATSLASTTFCLGLVLVFVALMLFVVRPQLRGGWISSRWKEAIRKRGGMAAVLLILFTSALATELIGIHALLAPFSPVS